MAIAKDAPAIPGHPRPTARRRCEPVLVSVGPIKGADGTLTLGADGAAQPVFGVAMRTPLPPICAALPPDLAEALLHYAARFERVAGSGGGLGDPSGVRSTVPSAGPTIGKLVTAEELRHMDRALAAVSVVIRPGASLPARLPSAGRMSRAQARAHAGDLPPAVTVAARDLVVWFVIEGATALDVLRRLGLPRPTQGEMARLRDGVTAAATALHRCIASGKAGKLATI